MNRNVSAQISYDRLNKGVDIRNPSTASFLIDSADRKPRESSSDFTITPTGQNLFTGFFTRFGLTEIVLNWGIFNISQAAGSNTFSFRYSGVLHTVTLRSGFYNVQETLDAMVVGMNAAVGPGVFSVGNSATFAGVKAIIAAPGVYHFVNDNRATAALPDQLGFPTFPLAFGVGVSQTQFPCISPDITPYSYLDFTSPQLASQQDVKDASTSPSDAADSIYRWTFSDTVPNAYDTYGYPILQSYRPFVQRRYLSFPKQIRWDPAIPLGQIQFQVKTSDGAILQYGYQDRDNVTNGPGFGQRFNWNMLMLVSEV
jgi:hypothetical protein